MHVKTKVEITGHAKVRMAERKWTNEDVLAAIEARDPHVVTETIIRVVSVLPKKISKKQARQQPEVTPKPQETKKEKKKKKREQATKFIDEMAQLVEVWRAGI